MDKELKCPSCGVALHLVDDLELQVVNADNSGVKEPVVDVVVAPVVPAVDSAPSADASVSPDVQA